MDIIQAMLAEIELILEPEDAKLGMTAVCMWACARGIGPASVLGLIGDNQTLLHNWAKVSASFAAGR